jgi:hypothetical protein
MISERWTQPSWFLVALVLVAACSKAEHQGPSDRDAGTSGSGGASGKGTGGGNAQGSGGTRGSGGRTSTNGSSGSGGAAVAHGGGGGGQAGRGTSMGMSGDAGSNTGMPGQIGGCDVFTADDAWNRDITSASVDADWTTKIHTLVGDIKLHPDYGNSGSEHYGIPINTVAQSQAAVAVSFDDYPDESDPGPYPLPDPSSAKIEGGTPSACDGDCHFLVVQSGSCMLYEGYACHYASGWHCANGAKWDLSKNSYGQRKKGWTSADAAGLAITPGLVRYDEVAAGQITHAIRFTLKCTRANFVAPATHDAVPSKCDPNDPNAPPMGLRVRLRADYDLSKLSAHAQVVAKAMQHYGLMLADNGSNFYFQGEDSPSWTADDVEPLKTIPASAFEALTPGTLEK